MSTQQLDLFSRLPGVAGGRALRDQRGTAHLVRIGSRGGMATVQRYGHTYMRVLGERGRQARLVKKYTHIRTEQHWDGTTYRIIPWHPHPGSFYSTRRRTPILVRIEQEESA